MASLGWPLAAGTWPSFPAGGGPQVLGWLGRVTCCQSRAAWHSQCLCCSYSPCSPSGLLPVLAQLTPKLGTQETWAASGRNIPVPVMPTSSGTPRCCVDPGQQADCAVLLPLSLAGRCHQLPHPSWGRLGACGNPSLAAEALCSPPLACRVSVQEEDPLHAQRAPSAAPLPRVLRTHTSPNIETHNISTGVSWCLLIKHELLGNCTSQLC